MQRKYLYLSKKFENFFFEQIYNNNYYTNFLKIFKTIITNFYFSKLTKQLKQYIVYYC